MKYLCLVYGEEAKLDVMPQSDIDALIDEALANREELRESGQLILAEALEHVEAATTVRVRNSKLSANTANPEARGPACGRGLRRGRQIGSWRTYDRAGTVVRESDLGPGQADSTR